ncbi:transcription antitermination factor NusB [Cellulophaga omnivescoria]|uniref:transcription antitermination factor NusB n=1 Tax=Cellulophaga omnivescoria TaxID=1888890 RepID=UPI000986EE1F|nr:transcription antitermination factor NusB [Cellulophaga omnivescoria]WBU89540.1 transcription antitermination factor NusB [Cellulophaga omnivescoria]WKB81563.1 transcription antitermination factor NusB [Cellulophaga lytica]
MLTRRHIRVKVMQCIYALTHSQDDTLEKQVKFLKYSVDSMYTLYLLMLSLLVELQKRAEEQADIAAKSYLGNVSDAYPNRKKFVNNRVLLQIADNKLLLEELSSRKLNNWYLNEEYIRLIYKEVTESEYYTTYMTSETSSYEEDKNLLADLYKNVIAPNEKIYDYFEDDKLTWVDDIPIINTFVLKLIKKAKPDVIESYFLPELLKEDDDMVYAKQLLTKTLLNDAAYVKEIVGKTPNWDKDRIADIDGILLKMAICELLNFPSIPEKVTINEFLEIAKEYSTPKSSIFINGILDKLVREYKSEGKLKKIGRGLL